MGSDGESAEESQPTESDCSGDESPPDTPASNEKTDFSSSDHSSAPPVSGGASIGSIDPTAFRSIVEAGHDGIVVFDADCHVTYIDPAFDQTFSTDAEAVIGKRVTAVDGLVPFDSATLETIADAVTAVGPKGTEATTSRTVETGLDDGLTAELQFARLPAAVDVGDVVATVRDVTERSRAERELRESRRKIERLHDAATEIVACRTEQEVADRAVRAAEEILDFDVCSLTLRRGEWFVPVAVSSESPEDGVDRYHKDEGLLGKTYQTGESHRVDDVHADSTSKPADDAYRSGISVPIGDLGVFQATATEVAAFDDDDIELAETLLSHVAETLRRINTETELREREAELVTQRDRFAALFENVPDPVVSFRFEDDEPIVADVNGPFESVFGYDESVIIGDSIDEHIVPDERADEATALNDVLQSGERLQTATQRKTTDGLRDFLLNVVPVDDTEEQLRGYAIYTDITEQKERERELEQQNERLDEFASIVSHDLQNPLSVAEGYLELARETGETAHFDEVTTAHERMRQLIDELLVLAREGQVTGEHTTVNLGEAASQAWLSIDAPNATLIVEVEKTVEADYDRLVELFENLFGNAVDHAGADCTITVKAADNGVAVVDDGPGFDDDPEKLFEPGYTTADDGTGFGLTIVRRIASAHGWEVNAVDNDDEGARFTIQCDSTASN